MRVLFAGSPAIAVPSLEALADLSLEGTVSLVGDLSLEGAVSLVGLLTNPDSPRGRRGAPQPTDTAAAAERIAARF
ncbi:MAG: hypothetical protein LBI85_03110, partial [Spirochaetaceae bacterium]|nr:hypothetical protein [Spirochaetaceae bacterium]